MKMITAATFPNLRRAARRCALALVLVSILATTACFGRFPITRELYKFNKDSSPNEFVQTIVFWVFCLLPYPGGVLIDTLVLNAIEFWTGNTVNLADGGGHAIAKKVEAAADGGLVITVALPDGGETMLALKPVGEDEFALIGTNGRTTAVIKRGPAGEAMFYSPDGMLLRTLPAPAPINI